MRCLKNLGAKVLLFQLILRKIRRVNIVYIHRKIKSQKIVAEQIDKSIKNGAGEIILNSVDRDGTVRMILI